MTSLEQQRLVPSSMIHFFSIVVAVTSLLAGWTATASAQIERRDVAPRINQPKGQTLRLPRVFGDHMVLQADMEIPVWGWATPFAEVCLKLGNETKTIAANKDGSWAVRFPARSSNANPTTMTLESGGERIILQELLIGEVWLCAGQSNMEWPLNQSANAKQELADADQQQFRLLNLIPGARGSSGTYTQQHLRRLTPETFCDGRWKVASANSASSFSAVAWHFGRQLQKELDVPVGLICPAAGGTPTEAWIPREALEANPKLKGLVVGNWLENPRLSEFCRSRGKQNLAGLQQANSKTPGDELGPNHSFKPGFMWEAAIEPLIPFGIRGVIWYQGESNAESADRAREHEWLLTTLIDQWRTAWSKEGLPFIFVQLPAMHRPHWPAFREGQRRILAKRKNVGMAITIDTGHPTNVHPKDKQPIGQRLSAWALGTTYRSKRDHKNAGTAQTKDGPHAESVYSGPLLSHVKRKRRSIVVSFEHVGDGLRSIDGMPLRHFELCGIDGQFFPAKATILDKDSIELSSDQVKTPQEARYAWRPYPEPPVNLINSANLPASPFTSNFKMKPLR